MVVRLKVLISELEDDEQEISRVCDENNESMLMAMLICDNVKGYEVDSKSHPSNSIDEGNTSRLDCRSAPIHKQQI